MKKSEAQILITGVYRSGTEYLTQVLNEHESIVASMYRVNFFRYVADRSPSPLTKQQLQKILNNLQDRLKNRFSLEIDTSHIMHTIGKDDTVNIYTLYDHIMTSLYLADDKKVIWAEKNQLLWRDLPEFLSEMRNGYGILVLRDPRSVLASFRKYTIANPPLFLEAIFNCFDCLKHALRYQNSSVGKRMYIIRYEDFVVNPQSETKKISNWLGLDFKTNRSTNNWKDAYGLNWKSNSSFTSDSFTVQDIERSIHRWKTNLSRDEICFTEYVCGSLMRQFGYEPVNNEFSPERIDRYLHDLGDSAEKAQIDQHFDNWKNHHSGIQKFPLDPNDPKTWEENKPERLTNN